jgi:hypothetical protein
VDEWATQEQYRNRCSQGCSKHVLCAARKQLKKVTHQQQRSAIFVFMSSQEYLTSMRAARSGIKAEDDKCTQMRRVQAKLLCLANSSLIRKTRLYTVEGGMKNCIALNETAACRFLAQCCDLRAPMRLMWVCVSYVY